MKNARIGWLLFGAALFFPTLPTAFPRGTPISLYSSTDLAKEQAELEAGDIIRSVTIDTKTVKAIEWKFDDPDQKHQKRKVGFHFYKATLGTAVLCDAATMFAPPVILQHCHIVKDGMVDDTAPFYVTIDPIPRLHVRGVFLLFGSYEDEKPGRGGGDYIFEIKTP